MMLASSLLALSALSEAEVQLVEPESHEHAGVRLHSDSESDTQIEPDPPPSSSFMMFASSFSVDLVAVVVFFVLALSQRPLAPWQSHSSSAVIGLSLSALSVVTIDAVVHVSVDVTHEHAGERLHSEKVSDTQIE